MKDFAAIDFETANQKRSSVCSVGVVICRNGVLTKSFVSYIRPTPFYFNEYNIRVHGITERDVKDAPSFKKVWAQIEPEIRGLPLVAHNAAFDSSCLKAAFEANNMPYPDYEFYCTCKTAKKMLTDLPNHKLDTLCDYFNIELNHHEALSDAKACAAIALRIFN